MITFVLGSCGEIPTLAVHAARPSHQRLDEAFKEAKVHIRRITSGYDVKDHGDVLNQWIHFIEHNALVVLLKVPNDVNAYKMFETLNDRGLRTSQADLVKNYLFGQSGGRLAEAQQKWALMRGALESLDEEDITVTYLRHALIAMRGYLREPQVYEAVQNRARGRQASIAFISELERMANDYVAIFNPENEKWNTYPDTTRRAIEVLNLLNIKPMRPLMLAVATKFGGREAARVFRMLISWGVRLLIAGSTRSGSVEIPLAMAARDIISGELADAHSLKKRMSDVIPNDEQFRQSFAVATVSNARLARSLELTANNDEDPYFMPNDDKEVVNLEHLVPQRPEGNWPELNDEEIRAYSRRIGNLALLLASSNADLRSASFGTKKDTYARSPYILTREIAEQPAWSTDQIVRRQERLSELALRAWPL